MMAWQSMLLFYVGLIAFLIALRTPIAVALGITAISGVLFTRGTNLLPTIGDVIWNTSNSFTLVAIPMFILMGEIIMQTGVARRFYRGLAVLLDRTPGGLAHANIAGSAMFSAICGSSVATALTMGKVAMPELRQRNYDMALTTGSLAAGGTLGILIPPSIPLIIYAVIVQESIVELFMAGIVPGLLLVLFFMGWIAFKIMTSPNVAPPVAQGDAPRGSGERWRALLDCAPLALLIGAAVGSLYFGLVTPTEAGAFGALVALVIGIAFGELTWAGWVQTLHRTVATTAVIFYIIVAGSLLSFGMVDAGVARGVSQAVVDAGLAPWQFFLLITGVYILLGMLLEGVSMMLLTLPILFPSVVALGFDPVWFGVVLVVFIELGALTPPMGLNLFALNAVAEDVPLKTIIRGAFPFVLIMLAFLVLLYCFPQIALWLPSTLK